MKITGCICKVAGERIAVVAVQRSVLDHQSEADRYMEHLAPVFDGLPVVLMGQGDDGKIAWYGRGDLTDKMGTVPIESIPWQEIDVDI